MTAEDADMEVTNPRVAAASLSGCLIVALPGAEALATLSKLATAWLCTDPSRRHGYAG